MSTVALITGGSGGIGAATAQALARAGHTVLVGYRSNAEGAEAVAAACASKAEAVRVDVTEEGSIAGAIERAADLGELAVLVNNAGITSDDLLLRLATDELDRTLAVDLRGAVLTTKAAIRPMLRQRAGRIINVSSVVGLRGNAGQTAYAAAKAGLIGFTKSLAREVGKKGITANVVAPGYVETPMTEGLAPEQRAALGGGAPIGRAVRAEEVAAAIAFLASREAGAITGAVLPVDGGAAA